MKSQLRIVLSLLIATFATPVFAGDISFLAEPYAGWSLAGKATGSSTITGATFDGDIGTFNGFTFGARAGAEFSELVFGALDFSYAPSFSFTPEAALAASGTGLAGNLKSTRLGLTAGILVPALPIRAWIGFNFLDKISDDDSTLSGMSFKIGAGVKPIPLLSLNAEFIMGWINSVTQGTVSADLPSGVSLKHRTLLLTASVPFTLPLN
jgi:hypothetical protein